MSVALELEYEAFYPRLQVVPDVPGRSRAFGAGAAPAADPRASWWCVLLVLLMLPIRALGGKTVAGLRSDGRPGVRGPQR